MIKSLKISVLDKKGQIAGEEALVAAEKESSPLLLVQAVKAFLANQRRARAKVKTRAVVEGSKSKIYRQKGTGRARHGDRQAPIFVGGGVVHGPTGGQNYRQKLNQKMTRAAILAALLEQVKGKKAFLVKDLSFKSTKEAASYLKEAKKNLSLRGEGAFVLTREEGLRRYLANLAELTVLNTEALNPYSLVKADYLFLTPGALKKLFGVTSEVKKEVKKGKSGQH